MRVFNKIKKSINSYRDTNMRWWNAIRKIIYIRIQIKKFVIREYLKKQSIDKNFLRSNKFYT